MADGRLKPVASSSERHPLLRPGWAAFALVALAVPLAAMWAERPAPPELVHLARWPDLALTPLEGNTTSLRDGQPKVVDLTQAPCARPCIERTAAIAALAHGEPPVPVVSVLLSDPGDHPAIDGAREADAWQVARAPDSATGPLLELLSSLRQAVPHNTAGATPFPHGGLLVLDGDGSIRALVPATTAGVDAARDATARLRPTTASR